MPSWWYGSRAGPGLKYICGAGVPGDALHAVGFADLVAAAQRPVAAAGARSRLQHQRRVAGLAQFPCQHHAGDAGADDDDLPPFAGRQRRRAGVGLGDRPAAPSPPWCDRRPRCHRACRPDGSGRGATASRRPARAQMPRPACRRPARRARRRSARPARRGSPRRRAASAGRSASARWWRHPPWRRGRGSPRSRRLRRCAPAAGDTFRSSGPTPDSADSVPPST